MFIINETNNYINSKNMEIYIQCWFTGKTEVDYMSRISILVFEILEKIWQTKNCALVDMKIEFGVDSNGEYPKKSRNFNSLQAYLN